MPENDLAPPADTPAHTLPDIPADPPAAGPAAPAARVPELSAAECAQRLAELFPALFGQSQAPWPVKLRIQGDIQARAPGVFTRRVLSTFLSRHTTTTAYLKALVQAPHRLDLDGQPAGEVSEVHRQAATEELARRRAVQEARREAYRQAHREARRQAIHPGQDPAPPTSIAGGELPAAEAGSSPVGVMREEDPSSARRTGPFRHRGPDRPQGRPPRRDDRGPSGAPPGRPGRQDQPVRAGPARSSGEPRGPRGRPPRPHAPVAPPGGHPAAQHPRGETPHASPEAPGQRERAALLWAFETSTLSKSNFCVLKRLSEAELDAQLALARQERGLASARPAR